jgi:hypothetical protein
VICIAIAILCSALAAAQELEPRSYSPAPVGTNFAAINYGRATGSVVLDPTLPITNASADFNAVTVGYVHVFGFLGRQTSLSIGAPYVWGTGEGLVNGAFRRTYRSGLGDPRLRFSFIFYGSPAVGPAEFKKHKSRTVVGTSMVMVVPLGQYDPNLLINIGSNRWAFKPEIGISRTLHSWMLEVDLGSWFFMQNSKFFQGQVREQAPLGSAQAHLSYTVRPGLWVALDGTYYTGGRTHVDGVRSDDLQQNSRLGTTMAVPLTRTQSLKLAYNRGASVRKGGNFTTVGITYQLRWFTPR